MMDQDDEKQPEPTSEEQREAKVVAAFHKRLKASRSHFGDWRKEARDLYGFLAGHQWQDEDAAKMDEMQRPMVTFNLAAKFIDAVVGVQINNRQEVRFYPREQGDAGVSDLATGAVAWNRDLSDAEDEETDAFHDLLVCGMGFIECRLEDTTDAEGFIAQERRDPLQMYPDPAATKRNLSDARYIIRLVPYTKEQYQERFGEISEDAMQSSWANTENESVLEHIKTPEDYDEEGSDASTFKDYIYVGQYQWWELMDKVLVTADLGQGPQTKEFDLEEWAALEPKLQGIPVETRPIKQRCYYQAFVCGGEVKGEIVKLPTSSFTLKAITGKRDRKTGTWYGIGRNIKDPNLWVNKFFSSILWVLSVNPKGGLLAERGAFESASKAEDTWARPDAITFVKDGALVEGRVQPKPPTNYPQGMDRLMEFSLRALPEVSGINLELLGLADRQQAGVLEAQRKQSAMAIIAWAFDSMRRYYKESGRLMLELVREFIADNRLIRIAGEDGAQYVPLVKDELTGIYDVIVEEAPTSTNMKERTWAILQEVIPAALQAGVAVPKEVIEYAPIPEALAQKWKQSLQPSPEQQQQEQQKVMLMVKQALADIAETESKAKLNEAKTAEIQGSAQVKAEGQHIQNLKTAAEAGRAQAGGM